MGLLDRHLRGNTERVKTQDGKVLWSTHSGYYCKAAIANPEKTLTADGKSLSQYGDVRRPYPSSFHPKIHTYAEINENDVH